MPLPGYVYTPVLLLWTFVMGVLLHELSHIIMWRLAGVSCTVKILPSRDDTDQLSSGIGTALAKVRPTTPPRNISPWYIRSAALMPLCLASPLVLIFFGVIPNPFLSGDLGPKLALIIWLGCSIPSPQDFSLAWYPEKALAAACDDA
jgi:hypothetical protein